MCSLPFKQSALESQSSRLCVVPPGTTDSDTIQKRSVLGAGSLRAHMDRTQAARLYAGNIEYGYFVREMEARCQEAGVAAGQNADQLIAFAASLSEEDLRSVHLHHSTSCAVIGQLWQAGNPYCTAFTGCCTCA